MDAKLPKETFLALAAIGWADGSLQRVEAAGLLRAARECGVDGDDLAAIESAAKARGTTLAAIDLRGLSRWKQVLTYALASWFAALDGVISTSEHETLVKVGDALGLDPALRARAAAAANDIACLPGGGKPDRYDFVRLEVRLRERLPTVAAEKE
jgi:hypothetical protein